ncbi:Hypothetical predicted protein [Pelobates cultripes]|uniref:Uncharacterized protein n=1 Tax=Pelobates cultripes TaxID=61616 RepID=A0AAD1SWP8_PELCU|nr:Hypothetical predicted protein [Pelobates cultripes]
MASGLLLEVPPNQNTQLSSARAKRRNHLMLGMSRWLSTAEPGKRRRNPGPIVPFRAFPSPTPKGAPCPLPDILLMFLVHEALMSSTSPASPTPGTLTPFLGFFLHRDLHRKAAERPPPVAHNCASKTPGDSDVTCTPLAVCPLMAQWGPATM